MSDPKNSINLLRDGKRAPSGTWRREVAKSVAEGIKEILYLHGYEPRKDGAQAKSYRHVIMTIEGLSDEAAVRLIKYECARFLPMLLGDDLPPNPCLGSLFEGEWKRYLARGLIVKDETPTRKQLFFGLSMLYLKRACPPLTHELGEDALIGLESRLEKCSNTPQRLIDEVVRTAYELFPPGWDAKTVIPKFVPSNKSCWEASVKAGGNQAILTHDFDYGESFWDTYQNRVIDYHDSLCFQELLVMLEPLPGVVTEVRSWQANNQAEFMRHTENYLTFHGRETLKCKAELVDDPLKKRVITKGHTFLQALKPIQKMIWSTLKDHPCFELIGKPITEGLLDVSGMNLGPGEGWISGDYEAATDNLNADCTSACIRTIVDNMTGPMTEFPEILALAKNSLTQHEVFYYLDGKLRHFLQKNGQLMGSLLSFPVLCIINFAVWRHVREEVTGKRCNGMFEGGKQDVCRINGDDILCTGTPKFYGLWKSKTTAVGLKFSLGKNYYSSKVLMINSRAYVCNGKSSFERLRFYNPSLLLPPGDPLARTGQDGKLDSTIIDPIESLGSMHNDFVENMLPIMRARGSNLFVRHHIPTLAKTWRNLFGPNALGGLGAHPVPGTTGFDGSAYRERQLLIATLVARGMCRIPSSAPKAVFTDRIQQTAQELFCSKAINWSGPLTNLQVDVTEHVEDLQRTLEHLYSWTETLGLEPVTRSSEWKLYRGVPDLRGGKMSFDEYLNYIGHERQIIDVYNRSVVDSPILDEDLTLVVPSLLL